MFPEIIYQTKTMTSKLTLSAPENLKNAIFETPVIPQLQVR